VCLDVPSAPLNFANRVTLLFETGGPVGFETASGCGALFLALSANRFRRSGEMRKPGYLWPHLCHSRLFSTTILGVIKSEGSTDRLSASTHDR